MAPFHSPTARTAWHRSGSRFPACLQTHVPSSRSVSDQNLPPSSTNRPSNPRAESNNAPRSSLGTILSRFHLGRRGVKDQPTPSVNPGQTDAGMAEPAPLESEPGPPFSVQKIPQNCSTEVECQDLAWLVRQLASHDTRASARSPNEDDANSDYTLLISDDEDDAEDDANSDYTLLISDDDDDAEDVHNYALLAAYNPWLNQPAFFFGMHDTGAALSILSYAKACLVAPDDVSNDFSHVGKRTLDVLGDTVTVHGPIWIKVCLQNDGSRTRYEAPFYVLPTRYGKAAFDALLSLKLLRRLGLA